MVLQPTLLQGHCKPRDLGADHGEQIQQCKSWQDPPGGSILEALWSLYGGLEQFGISGICYSNWTTNVLKSRPNLKEKRI